MYAQDERTNTSAAPLLSIIVRRGSTLDVPVPPFWPRYEPHHVPWKEKRGLGFFRWVICKATAHVHAAAGRLSAQQLHCLPYPLRPPAPAAPNLYEPLRIACRGTPYCGQQNLNGTLGGLHSMCARDSLPKLSLEHPDLLNVTISEKWYSAPGTPGPPVPHHEHARYK